MEAAKEEGVGPSDLDSDELQNGAKDTTEYSAHTQRSHCYTVA